MFVFQRSLFLTGCLDSTLSGAPAGATGVFVSLFGVRLGERDWQSILSDAVQRLAALTAKQKVHRRDVWYTSTCDAALAIGSHGMVYGVARNLECQPTPQSNQCVWGPVASGIVEAPTLPGVLGSHSRACCNLQQGIDLSCCAVHRSCVSGCGGCLHCFIVCCVSWVLADSLLVTYHAAPCPSKS